MAAPTITPQNIFSVDTTSPFTSTPKDPVKVGQTPVGPAAVSPEAIKVITPPVKSTAPAAEVPSPVVATPIPTPIQTPTPIETVVPPPPAPSMPVSPVKPAVATVTSMRPPRKGPSKLLLVGALILVVLLGAWFLFSKLSGGVSKVATSGDITWWGLWEDETVIQPLIAEYQTKNPKVKITYVRQSPQDYRERLTSALAKGNGPDIFTFHNSWVPMFKGSLDPVPAVVASASEFAEIYYPVVTSDLTSGTGLTGIPLEYDALTLFINTDLFSAANLNPPTTWDEVRTTACNLTKIENDIITTAGVAMGRTENVDHWPEILALMLLQNGASLASPTGKLAEDALNFYTIFASSAACESGRRVWDSTLPNSTTMFAGGKLAMYFAPSWRSFEIVQKNPNLKFKTVPLPQLPKASIAQKDMSYATYWVQGVSAKSSRKETAWNFLKFLSTSDSLSKMYTNAAKIRLFGEPYPRVEMANLISSHDVLGSIINKAPNAESWYLQSDTHDGPTGINTLINKYFEDAVNAVNKGTSAQTALQTASQGVTQVLRQYGITK